MPLLPSDVLNAVVASTDIYLDLVKNQGLGVTRSQAIHVMRTGEQDLFSENQSLKIYQCLLPSFQGIQPNTSVTFVPADNPGDEIEVLIIHYNKSTGDTTFASAGHIEATSGEIVVDFRWLLRRCRNWYQERGHSIHSPETLNARLVPTAYVGPVGMTAEQEEAVRTILGNKLSYVWGPPGTGKTRMVLAAAVKHCVEQGLKVLVAASTNLGVDNALIGVLESGIERSKVLRLGVPSDDFQRDYSECCEQRVVMKQIEGLRSEIAQLEDTINRLHDFKMLKVRIVVTKGAINTISCKLAASREQLGVLSDSLSRAEERKSHAVQQIAEFQSKHDQATNALGSLRLAQRKREIESLERDQTALIQSSQQIEDEAHRLGFISRVFTGKSNSLAAALQATKLRLSVVEGTLVSKRSEYAQVRPIGQVKEAIISELSKTLESLSQTKRDTTSEVSRGKQGVEGLNAMIATQKASIIQLRHNLETTNAELGQIVPPEPAGDIATIELQHQARIRRLTQQIDALKQDFGSKSVLGMTLDGFIGLTMQMTLDADYIFVDEAAYACLAKTIPLLSIGCPIAMLGDHCQLPPICETKENTEVEAYWAKSAIFLENAFHFGDKYPYLLSEIPLHYPSGWTAVSILRQSHRYSEVLANILDSRVYNNIGLTGVAQNKISIRICHCRPFQENGTRRQNVAEAQSVVSMVASWWAQRHTGEITGNAAVLTPYKAQMNHLRELLRMRFINDHPVWKHLEVMNTHKAQGREWDTVFFSAVDSGNLPGNFPFLADSNTPQGQAVLNTSISRVKSHLRVFFDVDYWCQREPSSMLTDFAHYFIEA